MKITKDATAAFSGHRDMGGGPSKASLFPSQTRQQVDSRLDALIAALAAEGFTTFLCGMAEGFDLLAGEAVIRAQGAGLEVELVAVVPHLSQPERFSVESKRRYEALRGAASAVILLSEGYFPGCYHARNDFLVDNAACLVCWYDGSEGGTQYTVRRAMKSGIRIENVCLPE